VITIPWQIAAVWLVMMAAGLLVFVSIGALLVRECCCRRGGSRR
jgi:hypothetical protein